MPPLSFKLRSVRLPHSLRATFRLPLSQSKSTVLETTLDCARRERDSREREEKRTLRIEAFRAVLTGLANGLSFLRAALGILNPLLKIDVSIKGVGEKVEGRRRGVDEERRERERIDEGRARDAVRQAQAQGRKTDLIAEEGRLLATDLSVNDRNMLGCGGRRKEDLRRWDFGSDFVLFCRFGKSGKEVGRADRLDLSD